MHSFACVGRCVVPAVRGCANAVLADAVAVPTMGKRINALLRLPAKAVQTRLHKPPLAESSDSATTHMHTPAQHTFANPPGM